MGFGGVRLPNVSLTGKNIDFFSLIFQLLGVLTSNFNFATSIPKVKSLFENVKYKLDAKSYNFVYFLV